MIAYFYFDTNEPTVKKQISVILLEGTKYNYKGYEYKIKKVLRIMNDDFEIESIDIYLKFIKRER